MWPDLNRLYVHPLFLLAGFLAHTAVSVLGTMVLLPVLGPLMWSFAVLWLVVSAVVLVLALYRQSTMEGSVIAE